MREDELIFATTPTTVRTNDVTYPLTEDGWRLVDGIKTGTFYTTLDMGFDRAYVTRYKVEVVSENKIRIDGINFYKFLPSLSGGAKAKPSVQMEANQVVVGKGQTLTSIAKEFGTTVAELRRLNNLKSDKVQHGETIRVY